MNIFFYFPNQPHSRQNSSKILFSSHKFLFPWFFIHESLVKVHLCRFNDPKASRGGSSGELCRININLHKFHLWEYLSWRVIIIHMLKYLLWHWKFLLGFWALHWCAFMWWALEDFMLNYENAFEMNINFFGEMGCCPTRATWFIFFFSYAKSCQRNKFPLS